MSAVTHYGPVYEPRPVNGGSFSACRSDQCGTLTTHKPWVTCESCKNTEAYRNGK